MNNPTKAKQIKNITIVLKPKVITEFLQTIPNLTKWLLKRKKTIHFLDYEVDRINKIFKNNLKNINFITMDDMYKVSDLIITLGGDGTLIGVARKATKSTPPIFGVNMGRLGFITEFSKVDFFDDLTSFFNHGLEIFKQSLYKVEVWDKLKLHQKGFFLNDAVISKNEISRMFTLSISANDEHICNLSGDGLIVSSPIGSTAYSLAAGGSIIHPLVNALALTPICPHSLSNRPFVIPNSFAVEIRIPDRNTEVTLTLDGQETFTITNNMHIKISKSSNRSIKMIKNTNRTYFHTLKEKFTHGRRN